MKSKILPVLILACMLGFVGCADKVAPCTPTFVTKYVNVEVPVTYSLKRPARPILKDQPLPVYVEELTSYTQRLEVIIDKTKAK